ncbi:MAG: M14 family metallocarboxypeptidase [Clostridia bacterium]|nr:M14 family metallocarboxypeptidase [Clostridia bacterium]
MNKKIYHTPTDHNFVINTLNRIATDNPILFMTTLGSSVLGKPIPAVRIGTGKTNLLYVGCHHGAEHITSGILLKFLEELCCCIKTGTKIYGIDPEYIFRTRCIYMVPMLNPDGVELYIHGANEEMPLYQRLIKMNNGTDFSKWQANIRGVDLNHNYDAGFYEYKELEKEMGISTPCSQRFSGEYPESEPETAALCNFIRVISPFKYLFSFHSQGEEIYSGYNGFEPKGSVRAAKMLALYSGYTHTLPKEKAASYGGLKDWYVNTFKLPAYTIECGRGENPLPPSDLIPIYVSIRKMLFKSLIL